jgi:hypothetical protein
LWEVKFSKTGANEEGNFACKDRCHDDKLCDEIVMTDSTSYSFDGDSVSEVFPWINKSDGVEASNQELW